MEKKNKSNIFTAKAAIVWFFIIIMTFSIGGFFLFGDGGSNREVVRYNNFNIYAEGNRWMTKIDGKPMAFTYPPSQLESINVASDVKGKLLGKSSVSITFDPNQEDLVFLDIARFQLKEDLANFFNIMADDGITNESLTYSLPIITCKNATQFSPVIYMNTVPKNLENLSGKIYSEDDCIVLEGKSSDFIRLKDRLMYALAGVMQ